MCDTCGCGRPEENGVKIFRPGDPQHSHPGGPGPPHPHSHAPDDHHDHSHKHATHRETIALEQDILEENNKTARQNRTWFETHTIFVLNLMSSPGSGKTTLLEKTITDLITKQSWGVIEGDQQTGLDAERIEKAGASAIQVNTGTGCHLDARMIHDALQQLDLKDNSILAIENVGNLVCPALFDLGENRRVVIVSTTEGSDKPLKYPTILQDAHLCLINKVDLLPYVDFEMERFMQYGSQINPLLEFIPLSAKTGDGLQNWYSWLESERSGGTDRWNESITKDRR